ncbi:NADH:flavin oxidoreductase/NADH oxidase [Halocatena salina]|uniref:NADH:flavin oxidoreductase/NADH oxidase n=1 Tax=Halocatena salina TaxID=2934340 RepID=A0A8U0A4R9_9EURY|nr:NADH:flavin oxidoreductase/NADH oxidase [Halocatena salina]UPM42943.1 NADH:flavin oxidoreductase/NADH oxidase [Halocatena salina]
MTANLFDLLPLRETTLSNRVMVSPMCQYSCNSEDGVATDWHFVHLGSRAIGGAGVVMTEAAAVEPRGRITPQDLGIWDSEHADALAPIASFIREQGSTPAIQLAHAGRKASKRRPWEGSMPLSPDDGGWEVIAPSSDPWPYEDDAPPTRAMNQDDIETVITAFENAAQNALTAGFEIAEVHAAHGYLLHEFLSPLTNQRTDDYGGSFQNRTRLLREVVSAVRSVWPNDQPVFVRISATDWLPDRDAWTVEESIRLADHLATSGVDLIDVSGGGIHPDQQLPETGPGYQTTYAQRIGAETTEDIRVGAVGGITTPEHADALVRTGQADLAIIGREHLRDPQFTLTAASELGAEEITPPPQYYRAYPGIAPE